MHVLCLFSFSTNTNSKGYAGHHNISTIIVRYTLLIKLYPNCGFILTGNSWGTNDDGRSCVGCGAQEEFYGCADVAIVPLPVRQDDDMAPTAATQDLPSQRPDVEQLATTQPLVEEQTSARPATVVPPRTSPEVVTTTQPPVEEKTSARPATVVPPTTTPDITTPPTEPEEPITGECVAAAGYEGNPHMDRSVLCCSHSRCL